MTDTQEDQTESGLPSGLARPAQRALAEAGISCLEQLTKVSEEDLLTLHGMGPKALELLRQALNAQEMSLAAEKC